MGYAEVINILIAVFAAFGICALVRLSAESVLLRGNHAVAVILKAGEDAEQAELRISRARAAWSAGGASEILLLVEKGALLSPELEMAALGQGVRILRIAPEDAVDE